MVVCMNWKVGRRRWTMGDCYIGEVESYKYLGVTMEEGKNGGCKNMRVRMKETSVLIGMMKYAAERSGSKYVTDLWKTRE